jgi:hypothetical protein
VYDNIPLGVYAIEIRIDPTTVVEESNETNNIARWRPLTILPGRPNLVVTDFDFSPESVAEDGGEPIAFTGTVANAGTRATTQSFSVEFLVWPGSDFQPAGPRLCPPCSITASLQPDGSVDLATLPARRTLALSPGTYTVGIRVDPDDTIVELAEDDNVASCSQRTLHVVRRPTDARDWPLYR